MALQTLISALPLWFSGGQQPIAPGPPPDRNWRPQYTITLGQAELDSDFWEPVDRPIAFGMEFDLLHRSGLGLELGVNFGYDEQESGTVDIGGTLFETDLSTELFELDVGLRYQRDLGRWMLFGGGGVAWEYALVETYVPEFLIVADDSDEDFGYYYHFGLARKFTSNLFIGLDVRVLTDTELRLDSVDTDADYTQFAVAFGGWR